MILRYISKFECAPFVSHERKHRAEGVHQFFFPKWIEIGKLDGFPFQQQSTLLEHVCPLFGEHIRCRLFCVLKHTKLGGRVKGSDEFAVSLQWNLKVNGLNSSHVNRLKICRRCVGSVIKDVEYRGELI
jgi:hypothetical protein